ncbi:MAG TPA: flagellar hook-length control protein FliK [Rhizomicrobium sp.]
MKIGAGADTRALNLSLPSGAAESTDISALFDELLALNVSAQSGNAPSNANAQPNDTSAAPGQSRSSQTTPQNFMQALLSTTQSPAQASATAARPIPAQPGNSGFPRVAALVANPAWPPRTGAAPQAAPAAANGAKSKIVDIKQQVNSNSATPSSGMASAKTIADLLESALSEAPAAAKAGSQTPANPAVQKPDVVMDARSFAKIASFVMPVAAKPAPTATASPSVTGDIPVQPTTNGAPLPTPIIQPASEPQTDAASAQTEADQEAASFADSNNVKFINSNGHLAAPAAPRTIATTRSQSSFAPPITVFDAIEGLRSAILPDSESAASPTLKMLAAAAQQSQTTPSSVVTPGAKPQPVSQAVSLPVSDPKAAHQISNFIAATSTNPVTAIAQPTVAAIPDTKNPATPAQSASPQTLPPQPIVTDAPQASDVKPIVPAQAATPPSVIAKAATPYIAQTAALTDNNNSPVADQETVTAPAQSATSQGSVTQPAVANAPPSSNAKPDIAQRTSAAEATEQTVPQDVQTSDPVPTHSQPSPKQVFSAKTSAMPQQVAADTTTLSAPVQSAPQISITQPTAPQASDVKAAAQTQSSQPVVDAKVIPQTAQPPVSSQPETQSQPIVQSRDAEVAPQTNSDPATAEVQTITAQSPDTKQAGQERPVAQRDAKQMQQPAPQHETKQIVSQQQDTPRGASADSKPDAQAIQQPVTAPQLVVDVKDIVQSILATQVSTASVKTAPQSTDNTAARGSLASAFAAAAAKSKSQPSQSQSRAAQTQVNGKLSADGKDNSQPAKNTASAQSGDASDTSASKNQTVALKNQPAAIDETPAIATKIDVSVPTAQTKNDAPAPTDITPDNATQNPVAPQLANSTQQSPQTPITLPNDLGVTVNAAQQPNAPHTVNIAASVQVAPQSQNAAHTMQADLSALALSIAAKSLDGVKHFDIHLDPAELGRVQVRLSIDESGKAAAHLSAERPQTLELLQRDAPALTRALKDSGVDLSQNGLNFSLRGQNQQNGNGNGAQSRGTPLEAKLVTNPEASAIPLHIKTDNVRLDIHV